MDSPSDLTVGYHAHPEIAAQTYRKADIFDNQPLWRIYEWAVANRANSPAITDASIDGPVTLTYAELDAAVARRAAGFANAGLRPGQRIVLQLNNSGAFAITLLALLRAGVVPVMTLPAHRISEIAGLADRSGAVAYIGEDRRRGFDYRTLAAELRIRVPTVEHVFIDGDPGEFIALPDADPGSIALPSPADPDLPALFLVSGGTTGLPKLIARTHNDYTYNARQSAAIAELSADDTYLVVLPGAHNFPLCCPGLLGMLSVGGHIVFTDVASPDNTFDLIEDYGVTVTALVPALTQLWCAASEWEPADISSLRLLQVGGAKLARPDAQAADAAFPNAIQQVFGMAEGLICYTRLDDPRELVHEVQGQPMSEYDEVRVVDEQGNDVPDGTDGELLVRGPYTIRGYYRADEHNARSFTEDGFYRSGDQVRRLLSGHLAVTGRIKDTIVRAGENVAADDIEEALLAHPNISQAAVVGLPDDMLGEKICAVLVPPFDRSDADGLDLPAVRKYLTDRGLASFKLPDAIAIAGKLPVTAVGKIDKSALRAELLADTQ
ncbi:putative 2,3-dihydroxybenzoate-AMP ligase [Gordonia effusa NBRC 100432]|uniref:Putative 2,3-dihydroxybenzoate-AMP ligase n=1 Tax=Gordonia effusa NBRC 100432 TaxID=1077974 RepID=H0QXR6_9ACTN|nr:AMP-binding protein [Gordonia effusa]GAB17617.1 putative 2,3-dihydroxybenzoate-AMP ligase [Gordonia effusa NBRC 100432]